MAKKEPNKAQEYLKQVKLFDIHINSRLEELAQLKAMATKTTSAWSVEPGGGSGNQDKLGNTVSKIIDMQREINKDIDAFVDKKAEVRELIEQITNPDQLNLLYMVYFQYQTLEQASCELGYSYRNVCYIHGKALQAVERLLLERQSFH